jgi:lambda repressor-like predicted transcriptional regulator
MTADGDRVCCHLCGRWYLSVASHLPVHGWSKAEYIAAFGLELGNSLTGEATRKRRSVALTARAMVEPAIQRAQSVARERTRSGALTAAASKAARGRPHPAERRTKTLATLAAIGAEARANGAREAARRRHQQTAAAIANRFEFAGFHAYVRHRLNAGLSLAAISREAGLHKDWLSRHLASVAPELAQDLDLLRPATDEIRLQPTAKRLGYPDVGSYLHGEHRQRHRTVARLAAEAGVSTWTIATAMRRHGIESVPHATKRSAAAQRCLTIALGLGHDSLESFITQRRESGTSWAAIAREAGLPETTLRRHGGR